MYGDPTYSGQNLRFSNSPAPKQQFSPEKEIQSATDAHSRVNYLRRMYVLLFIQLLVATLLTSQAHSNADFRTWILSTSAFTLWTCLVVTVLIAIAAFFAKSQIKFPLNWILWVVFLVSFGFFFSYLESHFNNDIVHHWLVLQTGTIFALGVHAFITKNQLTFQSASLYVIGEVALLALVFELFSLNLALETIYLLGIFALLWGFYVVWGNETIVGGSTTDWAREDEVTGSIAVYLGVFTIFLLFADLVRSFLVKARK